MKKYSGAAMTIRGAIREKPAEEQNSQYCLFLTLMIVIPVAFFFGTHVWMRSAYSDVFHIQKFADAYGTGVYRYRIIGSRLVMQIYYYLTNHYQDRILVMPKDGAGTFLFYVAYSIVDGVFFFLTNLVLLLLMWNRRSGISNLGLAQYFFLVLTLTLATYVVTPYDQIAYFFMVCAFLSAKFRSSLAMYLVVGVAAVAGTLNRETEFLVTPALLTVGLFAGSTQSKRYYLAGLFHLLLFAVCYIGLRILIPGASIITAEFTYGGKWALASLAVVSALYYIGSNLAARGYSDSRPSLVLLVLSTPYIVVVLLSGQIRELRLLVPLLFCLFFIYAQLVRLKIENSNPPRALVI
jgi:hypothetical protein